MAVVGVMLAFDLLPAAWFDRMETIVGYEQEGSAQGRLHVWRQGWTLALREPFTGVGADGYVWAASRDWHNAYVEVLAEHGFPALAVWLALLLGTMGGLVRRALGSDAPQRDTCAALFVSFVGYAVGALFLGLAYWEIYYQFLIVAALLTGRSAPGFGPSPMRHRETH
jgi:O-antigen ligase